MGMTQRDVPMTNEDRLRAGRDATVAAGGGPVMLARRLGISHVAVCKWRRIPAERVMECEEITGVPCWKQRPDLYREPVQGDAA